MKCPICGCTKNMVVDSRPIEENNSIRRRRECQSCHTRFTTFEIVDVLNPIVIKKDGSRELFDRNKLLAGLIKACQKRPVNAHQLAEEIEVAIHGNMQSEILSSSIGELVMQKLRLADPVAYVRYVSVHHDFNDIETFIDELNALKNDPDYIAAHASQSSAGAAEDMAAAESESNSNSSDNSEERE